MLKRIFKIFIFILVVLAVCFIGLIFYVRSVAITEPPQPISWSTLDKKIEMRDDGLVVMDNNWFRKSESGLYEVYVEGAPFERGVALGALTKDLVQYQEKVFNDQIKQMIPSKSYLEVLKYFVGWFNRNLADNVTEEYKLEILGVSQASSHDYDYIAQPYQRILNYHAAHDIGHALQNMSLVGCTSFATWDNDTQDSSLIIGRNFDFYVGDDFAKNKIVAFYNPDKGHKFMMITFGGMTGVLSGMNSEGLTVTINAAKSDIPSAAATPVSLVAREILQYASTIQEAYTIAEKRKMFVAESFLIGSAKDGKAAIVEKSNNAIGLYETDGSHIVCTNHFQSQELGTTQLNRDHMKNSASLYRYQRVVELLEAKGKNTVEKTVSILRNQQGLGDNDIGLGNEKAINQLIAHHGIVFQPEKRLVWISTAPWQLGKFVCYDLNKIFGLTKMTNEEIYVKEREIEPDTFMSTSTYTDFLKGSKYRFPFAPKDDINPDSVVKWNPNSYYSYYLSGDYYFDRKEFTKAKAEYEVSLTKEIATIPEKEHILKNLQICKEKLP